MEYDVVVIGSGLGGLLSAAILSKKGYHVCVVEKNKVVGGNLQTFMRDGVKFDTGMHYFGSADKGQFMYKLFKYIGIYDNLKLKRLDVDCFDIINYKDRDYVFAQGKDNFVAKLLSQFPKEKKALDAFVKKLDEVEQSGHFFNLRSKNSTGGLFKFNSFYSENAHKFLASITHDKTLQNVLAGLNGLIGGSKDKINMFIFGMINYSYIESSWRFVDGSSQLADLLTEIIKLNGGDVFTGTKITQCLTDDNNNINLIKSENGSEFKSKLVISNIHPTETFKFLP
ncbi:MAG: NAD(P)/FAD-dependent oxidoreductase, partial [Bacteroidales bacterium]|nr:NAD(P)/FAD-dependent oxidoreductase [Bacteroidales bacterium]